MCRNWKRIAALGLTVTLGCMVPMSTMLAAEDGAETEAAVVSDGEAEREDAGVSQGRSTSEEESAPGDENVLGEENAPEEESVPDDENAPTEENTTDDGNMPEEGSPDNDGMIGEDGEETPGAEEEIIPEDVIPEDVEAGPIQAAGILSASEAEPTVETEAAGEPEGVKAPEIVITRGGANRASGLGGKINFEYVNNWGPLFEVSVGQSGDDISLYYALDKVTDMEAEAKTEEQMGSMLWGKIDSLSGSIEPNSDGCYVVYVKVEAGGQKYYARSSGIVVDTTFPVIKGVEEGKVYQEGTLFQVEDTNLDYVLVNEQPVTPENGNYKVAANGTSCMIRAKDKAGNEKTCSITIFGTETPEPKPSEPETPDDSNVISKSGEYTLKAGVKYHLVEGNWKLDGDKSVYPGGRDFYVTADGSYKFTK